MKHFISLIAFCCSLFVTLGVKGQTSVCRLVDNGKALVNPYMGWTMHFYSNKPMNYGSQLAPEDIVGDFPGLSTVYLRLPWSFIEPEENRFNWEMLDTPAQRWIEAGKMVALRITATENWTRSGTPQWVFDAGAKYYEVNNYLEPDYDNVVFLQKVEHFVQKLAERYDGNPNVAFIDIGHYGMWGEGHTVITTPKHHREWGFETQKKIIDIYCKYFKHTQLCISDDIVGHDRPGTHFPIIDYALSKGVSLRDDSSLEHPYPDHWYHDAMAGLFWPHMPIVLEHDHYKESQARGAWNKELLLKSVEDYHASYMSVHWWPRIELEENRDIIDRINRRLGYRLLMTKAEWPRSVKKNRLFKIRFSMANAGVAPCYRGGFPCFTLKNERGGIVSVLVMNNFNVKDLPTAQPDRPEEQQLEMSCNIAESFQNAFGTFERSCPTGTFSLYFSVGKADGTPLYNLPYEQTDGHKRYKLGEIELQE